MEKRFKVIKEAYKCRTTLKLLVIYAIQSICGGIAFYISLFLKQRTALDPIHISLVISATGIGNIGGSLIGGYISDKYNPFFGLKVGLIAQGLGLISLIFAKQFIYIFLIMIIMGTGSYLYITASNYILNSKYNSNSKSRAEIISLQHVVSNTGMFVAAILMGYCAEGYYFPIFITVGALIILLALYIKSNDMSFYKLVSVEKDEKAIKSVSSLYWLGLISIGLIGLIYAQHKVGYPVFLESNFGNINTGYLMSLNPLLIIFFQSYIVKLSTKFSETLMLGIGLLFFGLSFYILTYSVNLELVIISCILITIGEIFALTYAQSISFGYAPENMRGRVLGLYKSIYSVTKILGSYLAGILIFYSGYETLWYSCVGIGVFGFIISILAFSQNRVVAFKYRAKSETLY